MPLYPRVVVFRGKGCDINEVLQNREKNSLQVIHAYNYFPNLRSFFVKYHFEFSRKI